MKKQVIIIALVALLAISGCARESAYANQAEGEKSITIKEDRAVAKEQAVVEEFWNEELLTGIEEVSFEELKSPTKWFSDAAKRGVNIVGVDLLNIRAATMGINSKALKKAGFEVSDETGNIYPEILREAKKNGIRIMVMLESLEHARTGFLESSGNIKKRKITPDLVKEYIAELAGEASKQGMQIAVDEEAYPDEYVDAIREAATENNVIYIHFFEDLKCRPDAFLSEDYSYYPKDARNNKKDREYLKKIFEAGSYYGLIGNINIMFGAAKGCNAKTGVLTAGGWGLGSKTHQNIALMRAIQNEIDMAFFVFGEGRDGSVDEEEVEYVNNYEFSHLRELINEYGRKKNEHNAIANIILSPPSEESEAADYYYNALLGSAGMITNAFMAAGYDVVVTTKPLENAEWYYYLAKGGLYYGEEEHDIPDEIMELVRNNKKIIFQAMAEIPQTENWNELMNKFGIKGENIINYEEDSDADPIPECADTVEAWECVPYRGYTFEPFDAEKIGFYSLGHGIYHVSPDNAEQNGVEVLATGLTDKNMDTVQDEKTTLLMRKGNVMFLNGGYVHLAFSSFLANLMAGKKIYNSPSYGYFINTRNRAAFFAVYDESIDVNLNVEGKIKVAEFDETGREIKTQLRLEGKRLYGMIGKFHLVVATGGGEE